MCRNEKKLIVVGFGDSITEAITQMPDASKRWLNVLENKLNTEYPSWEFEVHNSGFGGHSDREKMQYFDSHVLKHQPDLLFLEFGGNNGKFLNPERYVSPEQTYEYLEQIREEIGRKTRIAIITLPRIIEKHHAAYISEKSGKSIEDYFEHYKEYGGSNALIEKYREKCRDFAENYDLPLIDFSEIMSQDQCPERFTLDDGVHLTEDGNELLAELAFGVVKNEMLSCAQ
ncbi:MAG: hypothetical protein GY750_17195 [Lentisphaerae bacterium]|nr:hypothetical protein [Lentisphaerota bacterium]MCP4103134.1 hypothetical protein [Lentisphaerota bacterium]